MKINNNRGFNLFILCIVIMALAILMSSVLGFYSITNYKRRLQTTNERFQAIDLAIKNYIFKQHRFPCPAPLNCNDDGCKTSGDNIGISREVDDDGNCEVGNPQNGVFESKNPGTDKKIYYGGVPAITLGLDNTYISDGWGNKIVYIVPKELTSEKSDEYFFYVKNNKKSFNDTNTIVDENGNSKTLDKDYIVSYDNDEHKIESGIVYLLISFNMNKQGAYAYKNTKVNHIPTGDKRNFPVENFKVNTSVKDLLFFKRNIDSFSVGKIEEQMQICTQFEYEYAKLGNMKFHFNSAKYKEIRL